jgi:hypothetical protein
MSLRPDILEYFDTEVRRRKAILASEYRSEFDGRVRRTIGPFPSASHNWIDHFELTADDLEEAIDQQIVAYQKMGHAFRWKIYSHDQPKELASALLKRGFKPWEECTLMILDVDVFAARQPDDVTYVPIATAAALPDELKPICDTVWDDGAAELITALQAEMRSMGDHLQIVVAKRDAATIGTGLIRYTEGKTFGGLFAGSTIPSERGQGVYRGTVAARVAHAKSQGAGHLYTEAGPMSRPILESLGFGPRSQITNYAFGD